MADVDHRETLAELRTHLGETRAPSPQTPECLDSHQLAALAEGALDGAARAGALAHVARCGRCRAELGGVARALAGRHVTREVRRLESGRPRFTVLVPAMAAVLAVLLLWPRTAQPPELAHRDGPITAVPAPAALEPLGAVARPQALRWTTAAGADRYRVTVFEGPRVVFETQVADTFVVLPDTLTLLAGRPYLWKVEARTGWDRWSSSQLVRFTVADTTR